MTFVAAVRHKNGTYNVLRVHQMNSWEDARKEVLAGYDNARAVLISVKGFGLGSEPQISAMAA